MRRRVHARLCRRRYADKGHGVNRLEQAEVCGTCGHVGYAGQSHVCRPRT